MTYKFYCVNCRKDIYIDIPMSEYSKVKGSQKCPKCGNTAGRVIEWSGIAEGSGEGWFGKSDGKKVI